jgi:site-specific DNA-methyltransferase (adenine-specific)
MTEQKPPGAATVAVNVARGEYSMIPAGEIETGGRCRKNYEGVAELAESIKRFGLDNPITVARSPAGAAKRFVLVAGGRRLAALFSIPVMEIPVVVRDDMGRVLQKEFELEENLQRKDLEWGERIEGERMLDEIKRELHDGEWRQEDTAEVLGESRSAVQRNIAFAEKLNARPELRVAVRELPLAAAMKRVARIEEAEAASKAGVVVSAHLRRGDSRELLKGVASEGISLVLMDPPFGIGSIAGDAGKANATCPQRAALASTDNMTAEGVQKLMKWLMPEVQRVLRPGGHFYCFCAQQLWGDIRREVLAAGLELQEYPIVWWKGRGTTPGKGYMYTPCAEPIMFGWRPPRKRMLEKNMQALVECKPASGAKCIHPFQKPVALLDMLVRQSTIVGEVVLDPFAGSASTVVAAVRAGRVGLGFDLWPDETTFTLANKRVEAEVAGRRGAPSPSVPKMGLEGRSLEGGAL